MNPRSLPLRTIACLLSAAFLAGCTTINPYTGEQQTSKAAIGTAVGAAGGALVGVLSSSNDRQRRKNALIGAGIGALAGGSVGYYMDTQEAKLREQLAGTGVSVTRAGDNIILNMPGNVTFATDSADINAAFYQVLNSVALVLKKYDKTIIEVAGHTDSTGSAEHNQSLSERRAASVGSYLAAQGISQMRVSTRGYGQMQPIASNDTAQGRQQNRRVELTLIPLT